MEPTSASYYLSTAINNLLGGDLLHSTHKSFFVSVRYSVNLLQT